MSAHRSVEFFDAQFERQIARHEFDLNPFERAALPYLRGRVLDFGCGLGNLALYAARAGLPVLALDASRTAVEHLRRVARNETLDLQVRRADLRTTRLDGEFDTVVCIGLLMFFDCPTAFAQLEHLKSLVRPGGVAVVNVLTEQTSYMAMFDPEGHCLFGADELPRRFAGWRVRAHELSSFPAPDATTKAFATLVAERPAA